MTSYELRKTMGKIIQIERIKRGLSRGELAELMDVTAPHVGLLERGDRGVTCLNLIKLARVLEVPISRFFRIAEEEGFMEKSFLREEIINLTTTASEKELEFIIDLLQNIRKLKLIP